MSAKGAVSAPLRVAAFTGGRTISSARFRVRQFIEPMQRLGVEMHEYVAPLGAWPPVNRPVRPLWAVATLASRLPGLLASRRQDIVFFQRELLSTFRTLEPLARRPRVFDVDDAIWLLRESQIRKLVRSMDGVVCGNNYIASWMSRHHRNVVVIPTAVDTRRWTPRAARSSGGRRIIGWTGLHAGSGYLLLIEPALRTVLERHPDAMLRVVSDKRPDFAHVPADRIEFIRWSADNEVATMQDMEVGLMPLRQTEWELGKCSYKMLLYMSCGLPVVVSPVGMNAEVLALGEVGVGATSQDEWVQALESMLQNPAQASRMGMNGRRVVLSHFSLDALSVRLASYLRTFQS